MRKARRLLYLIRKNSFFLNDASGYMVRTASHIFNAIWTIFFSQPESIILCLSVLSFRRQTHWSATHQERLHHTLGQHVKVNMFFPNIQESLNETKNQSNNCHVILIRNKVVSA